MLFFVNQVRRQTSKIIDSLGWFFLLSSPLLYPALPDEVESSASLPLPEVESTDQPLWLSIQPIYPLLTKASFSIAHPRSQICALPLSLFSSIFFNWQKITENVILTSEILIENILNKPNSCEEQTENDIAFLLKIALRLLLSATSDNEVVSKNSLYFITTENNNPSREITRHGPRGCPRYLLFIETSSLRTWAWHRPHGRLRIYVL